MTQCELDAKLEELLRLPAETEWVEFKQNYSDPDKIGRYLSALSNGAALHRKPRAFLVWGIEDTTHRVVGTSFKPRQAKKGNEDLESWLARMLAPRIGFVIHEFAYHEASIVLFEIQATNSTPICFSGEEYTRIGSNCCKLKEHPEKARQLWSTLTTGSMDWSAQVVPTATLSDLDLEALAFARDQYRQKHPDRAAEIAEWDELTFLNKAKLFVSGKATRAALLLVGKSESAAMLSPAHARITWVLKGEKNEDEDYQHFEPPFLLVGELLMKKIRNLTIRHLPSGTLFPHEVSQYDARVLREILHNCIAHQDYTLGGYVQVVETAHALQFSNLGDFIPATVEAMIERNAPPEIYRNRFLTDAMVNLNMIDTIGSGIRRIYTVQRDRSFPMPDYDLSQQKVSVRLSGEILDENYTQLLLKRAGLDLLDVIALDKIQKKRSVERETLQRLRNGKLVEGRRPNLFVSASIADATGEKAAYIRNRGFHKQHYKDMVVAFLQKFGTASRADLDGLLLPTLANILEEKQKKRFVMNLLQEMRREGSIATEGSRRWVQWRLHNSATKPADSR